MSAGLVIGLVVVLAACIAARWMRGRWIAVTVRGNSMAPTFQDGQRLVVRRAAVAACARGDVVVFALSPEQLERDLSKDLPYRVKRVAAVAGDPVPVWLRESLRAGPHARIPPGKIVVAGDNALSQDSRHLGTIDTRAVVAVLHAPRPG